MFDKINNLKNIICLFSFIICFMFVVIILQGDQVDAAKDDLIIVNASEIKNSEVYLGKQGPGGGGDVLLNMDVDLTLDSIQAEDLTISGNGTLNVNCMHLDNSLVIKSGSKVYVKNGHIRIGDTTSGHKDGYDYNLIVENNASLTVIQDASYIAQNTNESGTDRFMEDCIFCYGHIKSSGNVSLYSQYYNGIYSMGSITIDGGDFSVDCKADSYTDIYFNKHTGSGCGLSANGNLNILNGNVSIISEKTVINVNNINIFGGNVYVNTSDEYGRAVYTTSQLTISGGKLEAESSVPSYNLIFGRPISISNNMSITCPLNGKIHYPTTDFFDDTDCYVTDSNGDKVTKVIIEDASNSNTSNQPSYSNEWVDGKWYNADGTQTYNYTLSWKTNGSGWWVEDSSGWYPTNKWQKINGIWYYFDSYGYMASSEWVDGWWLNSDGSCTYNGYGSWKLNSYGWWFEDSNGWYASSMWLKINNNWYYFNGDGYIACNQYIDGYWLDSNGVCQ